MELSVFLAKLFGLYLLIVGFIWLFRRKQFETAIDNLLASPGTLAFSGLINLVLGLAIIISHPIWELNWKGLVTVLGFLALAKGVIRLAFPELVQKSAAIILKQSKGLWPAITLLLGAYLTYAGFFAH